MSAPFVLSCNPAAPAAAYKPRGGAAGLIYSHDREAILSGPAETGKTLAACWKVHLICCKYPKTQGAIVRKTFKSIPGSVAQTFERVIYHLFCIASAAQCLLKRSYQDPSL